MTIHKKYQNGLTLVAKQMPETYSISIGIYVNVGSEFETPQENGYSHFIEHLLFKGTEKRTALEISEQTEDLGAQLNAYTSKDSTCYFVKCFKDDFEKCFELLSDMFVNAAFPEKEIEAEKNVVIEEITMGEDMPDEVSYDLAAQAIFADQKLGQTIAGTVENIRSATREKIVSFKNRLYTPENTVISVAGCVDEKTLDCVVEKYFGGFNAIGQRAEEEQQHFTYNFLNKVKDVEQNHITYAFKGFPYLSKDLPALRALSFVLGGGMSSRLFQSIRERRGLAYSIFSFVSAYKNVGYMQIYAGVNEKNLTETDKLIKAEIQNVLNGGISRAELERATAQAVKGLYMSLESNSGVMSLQGRQMLKNASAFIAEEEVERYKSVTLDDVDAVARKVFDGKFAVGFVGRRLPDFDVLKS